VKIVLLGPVYPFRGGIAQFSGVLAQALEKAGHTVTAVNFRKQFPKLIFPGKTQYDDSPQALKIESERTFTAWNPCSWRKTARAIEARDPDLIVAAWWMTFFGPGYWGVAKWLKKKYRSRIVYLLHNVAPHEKRFGDVFLSRLALKTANGYLCLSRAEEALFHRLFPEVSAERVVYSPHPIYDCYTKFEPGQAAARQKLGLDTARVILFFGLVRDYKGLDLLLRAMPGILRNEPSTKLVIAGEFYSSRAETDALIKELGIGASVLVHDRYIGADEIGMYFAAADCVVLPYRSATQSGIIQMAFALDTPVITTNVGGLAEVVDDKVNGYLVPPEDPAAVAEAVKKFYAAGGREAFEENVRLKAQSYSWEALVKKLEELKSAI
jgi:D-inositol-3-phosphate glycosyltransferase